MTMEYKTSYFSTHSPIHVAQHRDTFTCHIQAQATPFVDCIRSSRCILTEKWRFRQSLVQHLNHDRQHPGKIMFLV